MKKKSFLYLLLVVLILMVGCTSNESEPTVENNSTNQIGFEEIDNSLLKVHFIDVGQGDSILIQNGNHAMIIDAGNNNDGELVSSYIKQQNIKSFDYVIGTHPHEDHIGGLDVVINDYEVDKVLLPSYIMATDTYEDLLLAIQNKNLLITKPIVGAEYVLGNAKFVIIAPNRDDYGDNANNYSIGIKLIYGNNSFVMVGDAENKSEEDMIVNGIDLEADVLKVSHHGASTSNSEEFLEAVDPIYAVISVGKDNKYGHPNSNVVTSLLEDDVQIYRTDELGTIVITSNGKNINFESNKSSNLSGDLNKSSVIPGDLNKSVGVLEDAVTNNNIAEDKNNNTNNDYIETKVSSDDFTTAVIDLYVTETGTKYHLEDCRYLKNSKFLISLQETKKQGYTACDVCEPPQ